MYSGEFFLGFFVYLGFFDVKDFFCGCRNIYYSGDANA